MATEAQNLIFNGIRVCRLTYTRATKCIEFDDECIRVFFFLLLFFPLKQGSAGYGPMSLMSRPGTAAARVESNHSLLVSKSLMQAFCLQGYAYMAHKKGFSSLQRRDLCSVTYSPNMHTSLSSLNFCMFRIEIYSTTLSEARLHCVGSRNER